MKTPAQSALNGSSAEPDGHPFQVAVVGAGPSGCFTAQALLKTQPGIEVTVFDSMPTPYGLVRYGIAPDHQGAKTVTRQFDRLFSRPDAHFVGNVTVGTDIALTALIDNFDAVVLATGLAADRQLGLDQEPDAPVMGAGDVIRLLNSDPDVRLGSGTAVTKLGEDVVIIGTGNVALDVARMLAKTDLDLIGSDINDEALRSIAPNPVKTIHIIGRCRRSEAKWDASMLKELAEIVGVQLAVDGVPARGSTGRQLRTAIDISFEQVPVAVEMTNGRVRVIAHRAGDPTARHHYEADSVITAAGFVASASALSHPEGAAVFRVGGPATGRLGNLAENRKLAAEKAREIVKVLREGEPRHRAGLAGLGEQLPASLVDFHGWKRIDEAEIRRARPDRCRTKYATRPELLAAAASSDTVPSNSVTGALVTASQEN